MKKYENFKSNLAVLSRAGEEDLTNEFIMSGIIDKFSMQFELSWKVLKELMSYEGISSAATGSPRDILREAYRVYDFMDEGLWLEMLRERNNTTHIYDSNAAAELVDNILEKYIPEFERVDKALLDWYGYAFLVD